MDIRFAQAEVLRLLNSLPNLTPEVARDIRESVSVGEVQLALETMCSWIVEDELRISSVTFEALAALADEIECRIPTPQLRELTHDA